MPDIFDQVTPSQQQGGDIFDQVSSPSQSSGPANPYAIDMSKVAGATPGTPSPQQAAGSRAVPSALQPHQKPAEGSPEGISDTVFNAAVEGATGHAPDMNDTEQLQARSAFRQGYAPAVAEQQAHPVASAVKSVPIIGDVAHGAYETGAGLKDLVQAGGKEGKNGEFFDLPSTAKAVNRTVGGAMEAGTPAFGMAYMDAPLKMASSYFQGVLAGQGAQAVAKKLGMSPEAQEMANTVGFFIPNAFHTVTQLRGQFGEQTAKIPDPSAPGGVREVPVKTAAVGGRGFGAAIGKDQDGGYYAGARVGPFSIKGRFGGSNPSASEPAPRELTGGAQDQGAAPQSPTQPPAPPVDGATIQSQQQRQTVIETAARAASIQQKAEQIAAGVPPPPPPSIPAPAGMDDGYLSQQTVQMTGEVIHQLPEQLKPKGILEATGNLAKWLFGKKTVIGPDGKVMNVDSPKAAQTTAVNIINDEVERRNEKAKADEEQKQQDAEQRRKDAEVADTERKEALQPTAEEDAAPAVQIPEQSPQVIKARQVLASAPDTFTAERLDQLVRKSAMLTTPVRDALVKQEILRRAGKQEDAAQTVMLGESPTPGRGHEELQRWKEGVQKGEFPYIHVTNEQERTLGDVSGLDRTPVKGAGAFSGTYYHPPEVSAADIRKAARDKKDPQAALDKLTEKWKGVKSDAESAAPAQVVNQEAGAKAAPEEKAPAAVEKKPSETLSGLSGKKVALNLSDGSRISARHMVAELGDLTPSHNGRTFERNAAYPAGVQERSYESSKSEQMKVQNQAADFHPELVTNTDTTGATGPPVVTNKDVVIDGKLIPRGTVLGGNSRTMTLDRVYTNGDNANYSAAIDDAARSYGFPDNAIEESGARQPVHVLAIEPPTSIEELHRIGSLLNKPLTQALDVFDQAVSLAKSLSPDSQAEIANLIRDESDADSTATLNAILSNPRTGKAVVRLLEADGIITDRNRGSFVDPSTGLLVQAARNQLGNAMLATVLNSRDLMEQTPPIVKQKLLGSIGALSTIITRDDGYNIAPALREAARQYGELFRGKFASVEDGLKQGGMFSEQRGPVVEALIKKYDESISEVRKAFGTFAVGASIAAKNDGMMLMGMADKPEPYLDFNFAFGTELTQEQFDAEMKALGESSAPAKERKYKHGNTQADISPESEAGKALAEARAQIDPKDLAGDGLVDDAHITVRYGVQGEETSGIQQYLASQPPFEAKLGALSSFPPSEHSDGAVPIIAPVESADLRRMESEIDAHGDFAERSFPEYKPHATVAYVKPEAADKYVGMDVTEGKTFEVKSVSITDRDGGSEEVPLKATGSPRALAKGDKVTYTTNKGKIRSGEVAWTDGKNVRVKDGDSTVNKKISEVQLADQVPAAPASEKPKTLITMLFDAMVADGGPKDYNGLRRIVAEFDGAEPTQLRMKEAQDAYEAANVEYASRAVKAVGDASTVFDTLVRRYENQPNLSIRTSTSIENQAYSTPAPLAFIVDRFAGLAKGVSVYEPTAGNGMLLIGADRTKSVTNELDQLRAANLEALGFKVSTKDASTWAPTERFDAVVANPPFAKMAGPVEVDGYKIVKLDHLIAAKALGAMKDAGKASIIIGAGSRDEAGEVTAAARPFFNWLYSHYNVVSDFELEGDLYSRQGASFPVRVIAIDGRVRSAKVSPVAESINRLGTWGEVYERASQYLGSNLEGKRQADVEPVRAMGRDAEAGQGDVSRVPVGLHPEVDRGQAGSGEAGHGADERSASQPGPIKHTGSVPDPGVGSADITVRSDGDVARSDRLAEGEPAPKAVRRGSSKSDGNSANALAEESNQFQISYQPFSEKKDVAVMAPKAMKAAMWTAMERLADEVGDVDQWLTDELGYPDVETLHDAFMGLQVDSVALAIRNIQKGKGLISADQTGVGKGRQAAAVIRWAELHGYVPVFFTASDQLFTDMQRDLHDIGSGDVINPLLFNADATVTDPRTGRKIYGNNGSMRPVFERIMETGQLPAGRNAVYVTYSQINVENRQRMALMALAPRAIVIGDEIHNAGGDSNTGHFMQTFLASSKGTFGLSATYAKRPDNMPLYGSFTDIGIAIADKDKIAEAISAGGAPLQAVVANQLAQAGQLVRRERSFDGISIENRVDETRELEHEKRSDEVTNILRGIVHADQMYHLFDFERMQREAKKRGGGGERKVIPIQHMEFSSIVHNLVKQLLLALKAEDSADQIIHAIKNNQKPIFALENTMGSFLDGYVASNNLREGDLLHGLDYSRILHRALERTRYYNETDAQGNKTRIEVPLDSLSPKVREAYDEAQALVDALKIDLPVSPIDFIRNRVEQAGHSIAEITGRTLRIDYSGEIPKLSTVPGVEKKDRVNTASLFNNGGLDSLIINQAGSTGISLHASEKFRDQRQRKMIIGQPAGDVNIVMQILGRINRTGQVVLPEYQMLAAALPAEMRPAINLAKKMKSLNANTSSNTRSATSVKAVDLMNKYGDQVVAQYLSDNPDMQRALGLEVGEANKEGSFTDTDNLAMKATGRSALLAVKDQRVFMDAITEAYQNYIDFLDETGQNDLEPRTYDFEAKETRSKLLYQGTDASSPFGADAHYGEYSIKRQGKPFTPEEVEEKIAETFGELMQKPPRERDTLAARELADHMESLYKPYFAELASEHSITKAGMVRDHGRSLLNEYRVGTGLRIEILGDTYNGIVTKIDGAKKPSGNPYAPSALQFTIAINGPLRQVRVPGSQIRGITISNLGRNADVKQLFQDHLGDTRQRAKIITGNLLGAYGNLKRGVKGRIISFSMDDGKIVQGIIMPNKFDFEKDVSQDYAMRTAEGAQHYLDRESKLYLQSKEGEVAVVNDHGEFVIKAKSSKQIGGRFFLDPGIRALVIGGDFASSGGLMRATVRQGSELDALRQIMNKIALYPTASDASRARESDEKAKSAIENPEPPKPGGGKPRVSSGSTYAFMGMNPDTAKGLVDDVASFAKAAGPATMDDLLKAAKLTTRSMKQVGREITAALYPRALADEDAKDIMGRGIGHPALTLFRAGQLMHGIQQMFVGMPDKDQVEFVDRWQTGQRQPTADLQKAQEIMQSILEGQREEERVAINLDRTEKNQIELSDRGDYFPNRYKKAPGNETLLSEEEQIARMFPSRRPFEGSKAFMKQQTYTLKEAVAAGAEALGTPVDMVMRRLQEGAKFVAARYVMHSYKEAGIITFLKKGSKMPDGYSRINDKIVKAWRPVETVDGGVMFKETGEWVGQKDAVRLLNNYLSEDLIRGTETGQALVKLKNATTEIRLGFSPFHYGTITFQNFASSVNIGLDKLYNGGLRKLDPEKAIEGLADIGSAIVSPFTAVRVGGQMIDYARNPDHFLESPEGKKFADTFPDFPHLQELLFAGGLRWGMPETYRLSLGDGFMKEVASGHLGKATLHVFPWLTRVIAKPLFEHYIPRSKWAFAVRMLAAKLDQYSVAIANGDMTEEQIARDVASATENRFGEFNFDNLYWNNTLRTANQLLFRSVSWKAGTALSLAKAVKETFSSQAFNDHIYETIAAEADKDGGFESFARKAAARLPSLGVNAGGIMSMMIFASVLGTVIARLSTGKWPWDWAEDDHKKGGHSYLGALAFEAMHPRTGMLDQHGEPVRIVFPNDFKDYEHAATNLGGYVKGSSSDMVSNAWDTLQNKDAFGNYVFNPQDPGWKQFVQGLGYNLKGDFLPMSVQGWREQYGPQDIGSKLERFSGVVGGAPKSMDRSVALNRALEERKPHTPMTPEQVEEQRMSKQAPPTRREILQAAREKNMSYLQRVVLHELNYKEAKDIYDNYATPDEKTTLRPIMLRKQEALVREHRVAR